MPRVIVECPECGGERVRVVEMVNVMVAVERWSLNADGSLEATPDYDNQDVIWEGQRASEDADDALCCRDCGWSFGYAQAARRPLLSDDEEDDDVLADNAEDA